MPRIRTIKPEFFVSRQVADCSTTSRLLFVGTWVFADDRGVHPWCPKTLKMEVFPGDEVTFKEVELCLVELWQADLVRRFSIEKGGEFFVVTGWHHQRIDKPRYRYPDPNKCVVTWIEFDDWSSNGRRMVCEQSSTSRRSILPDPILPERKGKETISSEPSEEDSEQLLTEFAFPTVGDVITWKLSESKLAEYQASYPDLDHSKEILAAIQWCRDNPTKRKTCRGMPRFLNGWMERAQNRGHGGTGGGNAKPKKTFQEMTGISNGQTRV